MVVLVLALYAEGPSDIRFLPPIIQRTAENILAQHGQRIVDVAELIIIPKKQGRQEEAIFQASRESHGCHSLIVHCDADHPTSEQALRERIQPGFKRVQQSNEKVCKNLVPIIPVHTTEAWMLADYDALREVIGTNLTIQNLGLPARAAQVESDANPKYTLNEVIRKVNASRSRRHQIHLNTRYERLARERN